MDSSKDTFYIAEPTDSETVQLGKCKATVLVKGKTTGSRYSIIEWCIPPGKKLPFATSHKFDKSIIISQGPCLVQYYKKRLTRELETSSIMHVPRNVKCSIMNPHKSRLARYLVIFTPSGPEEYIKKLGALLATGRKDITHEWNALCETYGVEFELED